MTLSNNSEEPHSKFGLFVLIVAVALTFPYGLIMIPIWILCGAAKKPDDN